jgi:hypothetical protein
MKTAFVEKMTMPVKPGELMFAMDVIEAVGTGNRTGAQAGAYRFARGASALMEHIKDTDKAASLNLRAWAFADVVRDERIERWRKGPYLHNAVFVAAAELSMTDHGGFDPNDFFNRVTEIAAQYSTDELNGILEDGRREILNPTPGYLHGEQTARSPRITGNDYCPCKSGKKYKKCHGGNG